MENTTIQVSVKIKKKEIRGEYTRQKEVKIFLIGVLNFMKINTSNKKDRKT